MLFIRQRARVIALLAMVAILATGCGTVNRILGRTDMAAVRAMTEGHSQSSDYRARYEVAWDSIVAARKIPGKVKDAQWADFRVIENRVIDVSPIVKAELDEWERTLKRPPLLEAHMNQLRDAVAEMINLSKEIQ
jgi:hypothetical protein